jgi:hypothetical protein
MSSILDFRGLYFCAAYLPANNLRRISTIYLRGYWKGNENDRLVTIASEHFRESASLPQYLDCNTVFDMRLRVTFLRQKTVSLQSNIAHRE